MSLCPSVFTYPLDRVPSSGDNVSTFTFLAQKKKKKDVSCPRAYGPAVADKNP